MMRNASKRNSLFIITALFLVLIIAAALLIPKPSDRLNDSQIEELRLEYPLCGIEAPLGASLRSFSLKECIDMSESFVYGKVVGEARKYSVSVNLGDAELEKKSEDNEIDRVHEFYEYTVSVIGDTEGKYAPNDKITISANTLMENFNPKLKDGMEVVVPVIQDKNVKSRNYYTVYGMFYVTDNGYALSAYEENPKGRSALSGEKVDVLMQKLKK